MELHCSTPYYSLPSTDPMVATPIMKHQKLPPQGRKATWKNHLRQICLPIPGVHRLSNCPTLPGLGCLFSMSSLHNGLCHHMVGCWHICHPALPPNTSATQAPVPKPMTPVLEPWFCHCQSYYYYCWWSCHCQSYYYYCWWSCHCQNCCFLQ